MTKDTTVDNVERTIYGALVRMARDMERSAMHRDSARVRTIFNGMKLEMRLLDAPEEMMGMEE